MMQIETIPQLNEAFRQAKKALVKRCIAQGMSQTEAARRLKVNQGNLSAFCSRNGIIWHCKGKPGPKP